MRKLLAMCLAVSALSVSFASPGSALPTAGFSGASQENAQSPLDEARLFCYNRETGLFKHWGPCNNGYHHPRVYCRNSYTGEFRHWGACHN